MWLFMVLVISAIAFSGPDMASSGQSQCCIMACARTGRERCNFPPYSQKFTSTSNQNKPTSFSLRELEELEGELDNLKKNYEENPAAVLSEGEVNEMVESMSDIWRGELDAIEKEYEALLEQQKNECLAGNETESTALPPTMPAIREINRTMEEKMKELEQRIINESNVRQGPPVVTMAISDCKEATEAKAKIWNGTGGVFDVNSPTNPHHTFEVYCDVTTDSGGWTVFQRRMDGSADFNRTWDEYVNGFGERDKEFWLGLEAIYELTKDRSYEFRVDLADWDGNTKYAQYGTFSLEDASTYYRISVNQYSGTAGDSFENHYNAPFSTVNADHDESGGNCAITSGGPFWHRSCHYASLNAAYYVGGDAPYRKGIFWFHWKGWSYSLKFTEMKFRKK